MEDAKNYTQAELEEALAAISSTISKIEKVSTNKNLGVSQKTLIARRLKALRIASELIMIRIEEIG